LILVNENENEFETEVYELNFVEEDQE